LDKVKSGERTASDVVQCNEVFKGMETEGRFIRKHFLLQPPLTLADFPTLLLPDETHRATLEQAMREFYAGCDLWRDYRG
jgi:hypothetical protein